jgi:hypothetical protein
MHLIVLSSAMSPRTSIRLAIISIDNALRDAGRFSVKRAIPLESSRKTKAGWFASADASDEDIIQSP